MLRAPSTYRFALVTWCVVLAAALASWRASADEREDERETEFTILPVVGGDSDVGIGAGYIMSLARVAPEVEPYWWRLESAGSLTVKPADGGAEIPYVDDYLLLKLPHVIQNRLGTTLRLSFTREAFLGYYGLGNASPKPAPVQPNDLYYQYRRTHPRFDVDFEYRLGRYWRLSWGAAFTHNDVAIPEGGLLAQDLNSEDRAVRRILHSSPRHAVATFSYGIGWDTRDNEVNPQAGQLHSLRFDLAPGAAQQVPFAWIRANLGARGYLPLVRDRVMLAARLVADFLLGDPPFYELARYDDTYAIGGGKGVRGVPAQRYHGKIKVFGNLELRTQLLDFELFAKENKLGFAVFTDAGRLWADYRSLPQLDGDGLGLKVGLGAGPRLTAGKSFVLRADAAWSPTETGFSGYLAAGHLF